MTIRVKIRRSAALAVALLAATSVPAAPFEEEVARARGDLRARYQTLLDQLETTGSVIDADAHRSLEWSRQLAAAAMRGLKAKFAELGDATKSQLDGLREYLARLYGKATDRTVVLAFLKVEGNSMHAVAKDGLLKGAWNALQGKMPYFPYPVFLELRPGPDSAKHLKKAMAFATVKAMEYTGTDEVPAWVGFHLARGKIWGRPVVTDPTDAERALLEPLLGPNLPQPGAADGA